MAFVGRRSHLVQSICGGTLVCIDRTRVPIFHRVLVERAMLTHRPRIVGNFIEPLEGERERPALLDCLLTLL
jgi:hypothetical protein